MLIEIIFAKFSKESIKDLHVLICDHLSFLHMKFSVSQSEKRWLDKNYPVLNRWNMKWIVNENLEKLFKLLLKTGWQNHKK